MRAVIQRVENASVTVEDRLVGSIAKGLLVLLAVGTGDTSEDVAFIRRKILNLRVFPDQQGRMNLSLLDVGGEALVVSQFTLYGDFRKGNRPSYSRAALPEMAVKLYEELVDQIRSEGIGVSTGVFRAMMKVSLVNDGPVTLMVDSNE